MKNKIYRTVDFWKTSIMTLPENSFFELLRTVFGKIKTPFNKQILMANLEKFLVQNDIRKNIGIYINNSDARIISAIAVLNEPSAADLEKFFLGEFEYSQLQDIIINLEERFIVYRFTDGGRSRLALNPVLEPILEPYISDRNLLFASYTEDELSDGKKTAAKPDVFPFDDRIIAALISFTRRNSAFFRNGGIIRLKTVNNAKLLFPGLDLDAFIGGMQVMGLFSAQNEQIISDYNRFNAFGTISRTERLIYLTAGILCYNNYINAKKADNPDGNTGVISHYLYSLKIQYYAEFINKLCNTLDPDRYYPCAALKKLIIILKNGNTEINDGLMKLMESTGLLESISDKYRIKTNLQENPVPPETASGKPGVIAMDSSFTMIVYPEIAYNDAVYLAGFADATETGSAVRFELNKDSFISAYNRGISANDIIEFLRRLSNNRIGENLIYTLHDWEKRCQEVCLHRGLVLTLSPERRYLAETKPLSKMISETIAPGIYMLPETAEERASDALRNAGITILAHREQTGKIPLNSGNSFFTPLYAAAVKNNINPDDSDSAAVKKKKTGITRVNTEGIAKVNAAGIDPTTTLINGFHSILNKTRPGGEEHDELAARIDRRMILCESQLLDAAVRYEKLEARGLDYNGKVLIAKQAIAAQATVEALIPGRQKQERVCGIPKALEKTEGENILVIMPLNNPENTIRVSLGKISLLRRIKKSIFEE